MFLPVLPDETTTTNASTETCVGTRINTNTNDSNANTTPSGLQDVKIVQEAIARRIEAVVLPGTVAEKYSGGLRKSLIVVLAAKPAALSKFQW